MAEMYAVPGETLTGIADAIRSKTGSDDFMTVASMASAIEGISGGGSIPFVSRISSGVYVAGDDGTMNIYIYHNLGVVPKVFLFYTHELDNDIVTTDKYYVRAALYVEDSVTSVSNLSQKAFWSAYSPSVTSVVVYSSFGVNFGIDPNYMTDTRIYITGRSSTHILKPGARYNWIALA